MTAAYSITAGLQPDFFEHDDGTCITVLAHNECQALAVTDTGTVYLFSDGSTLYVTDEQWSLTITPATTADDWQWVMRPAPVSGECDGCGHTACKCSAHYDEVYENVPFMAWGAQ